MQYIEISNKTVQEVVDSIKEVAPNHGFGVQHIHNIKETLSSLLSFYLFYNFNLHFTIVILYVIELNSSHLNLYFNYLTL